MTLIRFRDYRILKSKVIHQCNTYMEFLNEFLEGDALNNLKRLKSESVDCCITSPPYWGLRDYGVEGQLGLEPDFHDYITRLADIFDEVKRVLKPGGTCWVNLGDSYIAPTTGGDPNQTSTLMGSRTTQKVAWNRPTKRGLPTKSLVQVPSRFAIEMAERGWILRNEIIWHKPNVMPASVKDRFTIDFEKLFLFVKSPTYYFEQQLEPVKQNSLKRAEHGWDSDKANVNSGRSKDAADFGVHVEKMGTRFVNPAGRNKRTVWTIPTGGYKGAHFAVFPPALIETPIRAGSPPGGVVLDPFMGSGTTAQVARDLGRHFVGIELNPEYIALAKKRLAGQQRLLAA